jgi:hypothetical protein
VQRKPVLGAGEFVWGYVLRTSGYPEGTPCSTLVARLVTLIDGQTTIAELLARLCAGQETAQATQLARSVLMTLRILYIDGTIVDFHNG